MSEAALKQLLWDLQYVHSKGWGSKPVLIMEQISGIDANSCWLWDNHKCDDGYQKKFFSQNYYFGDGSCLMIADDNEVYFWNADPNTNPNGSQGAQNDRKYCCEKNGNWDPGCWGGVGAAEPTTKKKKGRKKSKGSKKKKGRKKSKGSKNKDNIFD
ncbi:hypothetical protein THAOC_07483 [Thalassiosira oceanica]|uniref:Uncharacterized protein n=1 Tax=Thalassiosira oceanica TaxID=159749 RepID=K0T1R5_THAOC|nr:hypothetical protein THAOC_07483 [Thalassiosira oceanica]|eukprot:EJK71109.1 hypothetical protein THAOC_07483 [Thalassiosira oceanica]